MFDHPSSKTYRYILFLSLAGFISVASIFVLGGARASSVNNPPVALDDSFTVHAARNLTLSFSDPDGDPVSIAAYLTTPQHGSLSGTSAPNVVRYSPAYRYTGPDGFSYQVCDNHNACTTATVTINVVNQPPTAYADTFTAHGNQLFAPLTNDSDPEGDALSLSAWLTSPQHGTLQASTAANTYSYRPSYGFTGTDSFSYQVCDTFNACSTAAVTVVVVNTAPSAVADVYFARGFTGLGHLLANDSDADGDQLTVTGIVSPPQHGSAQGISAPDTVLYTPSSGYTGPDSMTYQLCDNLGGCSTATVYVFDLSGSDTVNPPWGCGSPNDPARCTSFNPQSGGLQALAGASAGASAGDPVNLATGRETYMPAPDLPVYNPTGPGVVWQRSYIGTQAMRGITGYGSPGLMHGWVHGYDITVQGSAGSWGAVTLVYPNGANESLTPQLNASNQPTGSFNVPSGAPYVAQGVPGTTTGSWQSMTVTWKDQTKWTFTLHSGTTYALSRITNRTGQGLNLTWRSDRALSQVTDAGSGALLLSLAYTIKGKLASVTDAYNRQVSYSFTAQSGTDAGVLQSVSQVVAAGAQNPAARWSYSYDMSRGEQLSTISVPSPTGTGNSTAAINYSTSGKVSSLVDANGNQRVYTYNNGNTQVQVKDAANNVALSWTQKFGANLLDAGRTDAANHSSLVEYNDAANPTRPTRITDRNGHPTLYTYDQYGNILTLTTPGNVTTTYTWDYMSFAPGRLVSVQEGNKPPVTFSYYEPSGLVQTVTGAAPAGSGLQTATSSFTYDSLGNILTATGPGNNSTSQITTAYNYTSDGGFTQTAKRGQPLTITDNLGHVTHLRYDMQGRVTSVIDALGNETNASYNLAGQPDTTTMPATGQTGTGRARTVNGYLYMGGPLSTVTAYDESGAQVQQVSRAYGAEGEVLSVGGGSEPVSYTYDALYRLKTLKDGSQNATLYAYNSVGYVQSVTMPGGETVQYPSYDADGNLLQRVDGNGVITNYLYTDPESQLTDIQYPASPSLNAHFVYDAYGRRAQVTDGSGSQIYGYGDGDELQSITTTYAGLPAQTVSYEYYPDGSRKQMMTPAGAFTYSYDAAGRAQSMTNPFAEVSGWTYFDNNWLQMQSLSNGALTTYTYNPRGQLTALLNQSGLNTLSQYSNITYDGAGNRTSVTASVPAAQSFSGVTGYQYDGRQQLVQEQSTRNGSYSFGYGYDGAGNPTSYKGQSKSYNTNNQQSGTGYSYDGNGNPIIYNSTTLSFDAENHLTSFGNQISADYRADGLRAWKQNSAGRTYFIYDGTVPILELDSTGTIIATNTFGSAGLISRRTNSQSSYYSFNEQGAVSEKTDSNGNVVSNHLFDSHGSNLSTSNTEPFGYGGQWGYYTDVETGLILLMYRYYDPENGRFLTRDPIGYRGGVNLYAYVNNQPINYIDPLGLEQLTARQYEQPILLDPVQPLIHARLPDYIALNSSYGLPQLGGIIGPAGQIVLDRNGHIYLGPGGSAAYSEPSLAGSLTFGWLNQDGEPKPEILKEFIKKHSIFIGGGYIVGCGVNISPGSKPLTATEVGVFSPQGGVNYIYDFNPFRLPIKW